MGQLKSGFAVLALWCGGLLLPALAAPSDTVLRERFLQAEKKIHKVPLSQAEKMLRDLHAYPLKPYIELEYISRTLSDTAAVQKFLQQHQGTPLEWPLKKRWLLYLAGVQLTQPFSETLSDGHRYRAGLRCAATAAVKRTASVGVAGCYAFMARWRIVAKRM